ncbi:hypothetical protein [Novosphingobium sp. ZW T3_23]|uniref:hypothetical protein n=1 Tax=Novosphingobium sp. ZW T3_23 TaxID=3378084 RepID=UPI003853FC70
MNSNQPGQTAEQFDTNNAIMSRGMHFVMGMDVPRQWATGAQAFVTPENTILVFREQNMAVGENGLGEVTLKNVASLVLPTSIAREFHRILGEQLAMIDGNSAE